MKKGFFFRLPQHPPHMVFSTRMHKTTLQTPRIKLGRALTLITSTSNGFCKSAALGVTAILVSNGGICPFDWQIGETVLPIVASNGKKKPHEEGVAVISLQSNLYFQSTYYSIYCFTSLFYCLLQRRFLVPF